ncbi:hypothetical protein MDA_GLEAN10005966 [Myotis davidii]|uniref:Protein FAM219B n=1 Tax=Myotis davidii TaxID=225400 RepID=L5MHK7_MYODS|nr:hypothetical protein MDA_GLEAN10005966 [Myotis davidii]
MATEERSGARPAGPASGRSGCGVPRFGEQTPAAVEKRGPYRMKKPRDLAKAALRRKGVLGAARRPDSSGKRSVKFNKGYTALSQSPDENLVSLNSDSDGELESRYSSGYSSAEASAECLLAWGQASGSVITTAKCLFCACCMHSTMPDFQLNQDVSRQLLQDGYHLDEIPDDEDLDLIPPKPMASTCSCCWCCLGDSFSCTIQ